MLKLLYILCIVADVCKLTEFESAQLVPGLLLFFRLYCTSERTTLVKRALHVFKLLFYLTISSRICASLESLRSDSRSVLRSVVLSSLFPDYPRLD